MTISGLFKYVEIKTKITSLFPFIVITGYLLYMEQAIDVKLTSIFFAGMFLFDLTTTSINNYIDTKTNGMPLPFSRKFAFTVLCLLLIASTTLGMWLVALTDVIVLILGGLCFAAGVLYTYGPVPISRQPWGELVSGTFYGLVIPFILLYINMPKGYYISAGMSEHALHIDVQIAPMVAVLLLSVSPVCCTANIMLANNISDLEKDILVKRHTLPYYIGIPHALNLFAGLYYITYASTIALVATRILHPVSLLTLATIHPVRQNVAAFRKLQDKETTFPASIQNYIIIMSAMALAIWTSVFITRLCV